MSIRFPFDVDVDAVADVDAQLEVSDTPSGLPSARISSRDKTSSWKRRKTLMLVYTGDVFMAISPATATRDSHYLLALATLGDATEIGLFLFMSRCPKWPRQVQVCRCRLSLSPTLSQHLCQFKHRFNENVRKDKASF